jgi:hypothetical protein
MSDGGRVVVRMEEDGSGFYNEDISADVSMGFGPGAGNPHGR